jgi:hypothetical protein
MDLAQLARFIPLIAGVVLAYHLIFKQNLPSKNLGQIATYFIGILIVFFAVSLIITRFFAGWATELLEAGTNSDEWRQFIDASGSVVEDTFRSGGGSANQLQAPTPVPPQFVIVLTPTPIPGSVGIPLDPGGQPARPGQYTVAAGDTLYDIAARFGTTVDAIMRQNGLTSWTIYPGQVLNLPAQ